MIEFQTNPLSRGRQPQSWTSDGLPDEPNDGSQVVVHNPIGPAASLYVGSGSLFPVHRDMYVRSLMPIHSASSATPHRPAHLVTVRRNFDRKKPSRHCQPVYETPNRACRPSLLYPSPCHVETPTSWAGQ